VPSRQRRADYQWRTSGATGGPAIARHLWCVLRGVIARQHGQSHNGFGAGSVGLAFHFMKEGYE